MIQHLIRNQDESSAEKLGKMYGVSAIAILSATFGKTGASVIYPWLEQNGGIRQGSDKSVPTGFHWSWADGMVVNVPVDIASQSPVDAMHLTNIVGMAVKPGGPLVEVAGVSGNALPPAEVAPVVEEKKARGETVTASDLEDKIPEMKEAGFSFTGILIGAAVAFVAYFMFAGKKTAKGKKGRK